MAANPAARCVDRLKAQRSTEAIGSRPSAAHSASLDASAAVGNPLPTTPCPIIQGNYSLHMEMPGCRTRPDLHAVGVETRRHAGLGLIGVITDVRGARSPKVPGFSVIIGIAAWRLIWPGAPVTVRLHDVYLGAGRA